jgi:AmmeMemoRadiSam system protein A/AmmeMemoRadiSam system protein B
MLKAYLVPHPPLLVKGVGDGSEIPATRRAMNEISDEIERDNPDTLVIISPHSVMYGDYFHIAPGSSASGDFSRFNAPQIKLSVEYDSELAALIGGAAQADGLPAGFDGARETALDHGVSVPLTFLGTKRKIVQISLSGLSVSAHYKFGAAISKAAAQLSRKIAVIASGDMSHKLKADGPYGLAPDGAEFDEIMQEICGGVQDTPQSIDFDRLLSIDETLRENAAECGYLSAVIMAGCFGGMSVSSRVLCYEAPYGVGYLTAAFTGEAASESAYVRLARENIESFVRTGNMISLPDYLPEEMLAKEAGVFVSLKTNGNLRGCIGTIAPTEKNIAHEILRNSVSAASEDPRFPPVQAHELADLTYSVDVLGAPEPIESMSELDVIRYGVIVTCGYKRGLLLPNLEGVDTAEQQVSIARQKAWIEENEPYKLERFEVIRYK